MVGKASAGDLVSYAELIIKVITKVREVRQAVNEAPETHKSHISELDEVLRRQEAIRDDPHLQTPAVKVQLQKIEKEAAAFISALHDEQGKIDKNKLKRYWDKTFHHASDEAKFEDLFKRMDAWKEGLTFVMSHALVGISGATLEKNGKMYDEIVATLPTILETNRNVKELFGFQLSIVEQIQNHYGSLVALQKRNIEEPAKLLLSQDEVSKLHLTPENLQTGIDARIFSKQKATDDAFQVLGDVGGSKAHIVDDRRQTHGNESSGRATQILGDFMPKDKQAKFDNRSSNHNVAGGSSVQIIGDVHDEDAMAALQRMKQRWGK